LGRLEKVKGVDILCTVFERCATRFPNLRLDIAGWGTLESALRERFGGHKQIAFHGSVFGEDKVRLLSESDLLIVPSVWAEVFGVVIIEAYTCGKPVIAARTGGIPEVVEEGTTGWLVRPGDEESLTEAICRAAEDPASVRRMSPACFEAAGRYSVEQVTDGYLSVYAEAGTGLSNG
jgi:glycosyltransferase involved in cell wall biosynthesis